MGRKEHAQSFMLPITITIIIPVVLMYLSLGVDPWFVWPPRNNLILIISGGLLIVAGLYFLVNTIKLFARLGEGTLSPLHPTQKLVVSGIYRHVRNPMITGVLLIVLGESITFFSVWVFGLFLFFFIGNHVYFIKSEEPGLVKRFGDDFLLYKKNVPRWIPRRKPWSPPTANSDDQVS